MENGSERRITIRYELPGGGRVEVEALPENLPEAVAQARVLGESLDLQPTAIDGGRSTGGPAKAGGRASPTTEKSPSPLADKSKPKTSRAGSTGRPGRLGSFEPMRELLSEKQQQEIREFVLERSPVEQVDQVLTAMYKGQELLKHEGFSYNEIYTLMWRSGINPLPKALDVVLQKLMQEQLLDRNSDGYFLKFLGRNRVERELPRPIKDSD